MWKLLSVQSWHENEQKRCVHNLAVCMCCLNFMSEHKDDYRRASVSLVMNLRFGNLVQFVSFVVAESAYWFGFLLVPSFF